MPFEFEVGTLLPNFADFVDRFLHVVFAKRTLTGIGGFDDGVCVEGLGDSEQLHGVGRAACGLCGSGNFLRDGLQIGGDRHGATLSMISAIMRRLLVSAPLRSSLRYC